MTGGSGASRAFRSIAIDGSGARDRGSSTGASKRHNDLDPEFDVRMGDCFAGYLAGELQKHGLAEADLAVWQPPVRRARKKRSAGKRKTAFGSFTCRSLDRCETRMRSTKGKVTWAP